MLENLYRKLKVPTTLKQLRTGNHRINMTVVSKYTILF